MPGRGAVRIGAPDRAAERVVGEDGDVAPGVGFPARPAEGVANAEVGTMQNARHDPLFQLRTLRGAADCARLSICYTLDLGEGHVAGAADCARLSICYTTSLEWRETSMAADCARLSICYT